MSTELTDSQLPGSTLANPISHETSIQWKINGMVDDLVMSLPDPRHLSSDERRGIISRYTAVLEGNFIYWMTATYQPPGQTSRAQFSSIIFLRRCAIVILQCSEDSP